MAADSPGGPEVESPAERALEAVSAYEPAPVVEPAPQPLAVWPVAADPVRAEPETPRPVPIRQAPAAPANIERALQESGLQLVETRPGSAPVQSEEPQFVPAKRVRRPPPSSLSEPLVQVETANPDPGRPSGS